MTLLHKIEELFSCMMSLTRSYESDTQGKPEVEEILMQMAHDRSIALKRPGDISDTIHSLS